MKKGKGELKNVYGYFFQEAWRLYKGYYLFRVLKLIISTVIPFISIYFIPAIVEELMGEKNPGTLVGLAVAMAAAEFILSILNAVMGSIIERYGQKYENHFSAILSRRIMELDFQLTEDKKALDQLELAKNGMSWYSGGVNGLMEPLFDMVSAIITLAGVSVIILTKAPIVLIIVTVIVIATTFVNSKLNKIELEGYKKLSAINRAFGYLGWELADFRYGKDIRLYEAKDMMIGKWSGFTEEWNRQNMGIANRQLPLQMGSVLVNVLNDVGVYFYLGFLAIIGKISVASCIQMITSASTMSGAMNRITYSYLDMRKRANYTNEFVKFMNYPAAMPKGTKHVKDGKHVFEFRNVSFSYPGSENEVLKNINLTVKEGEHLAVVGLNGAGKTTMIKLLCRLYDPTGGEILMDGVNIKEYEHEEYMKVFAPVFQDFRLFAFSVKENLLLKDSFTPEEDGSVKETLEKVGIDKKVETFADGINTVLFKQFDGQGIEPSGGEQQKLAIARALIKNAPVVVLDEPTAALDPLAEYEIYKQFEELVSGKTAIYISHRLSSCQFCDRIAVFDGGCVREYGTHAELVGKEGGVYAKMFAAQAQYYVSQTGAV